MMLNKQLCSHMVLPRISVRNKAVLYLVNGWSLQEDLKSKTTRLSELGAVSLVTSEELDKNNETVKFVPILKEYLMNW